MQKMKEKVLRKIMPFVLSFGMIAGSCLPVSVFAAEAQTSQPASTEISGSNDGTNSTNAQNADGTANSTDIQSTDNNINGSGGIEAIPDNNPESEPAAPVINSENNGENNGELTEDENIPDEEKKSDSELTDTPVADPADVQIWINDDISGDYSTLTEAVDAASAGDTIHMKGTLEGAAVKNATVNKNLILDIAGDTVIKGEDNSFAGITIAAGSRIQCSNGSSLSMSNFSTAFTLARGAVMADGVYNFRDNGTSGSDSSQGIKIQGSVSGSSSRESVQISADDYCDMDFITGASFTNSTVNINSQTKT